MIDAVTVERLLGREIVRCAEHFFVVRDRERLLVRPLGEPRQSEVQQLDRPGRVHQQVARLHVAMHEPRSMRMLKPQRRLPHVLGSDFDRQRAVLFDDFLQAATVDVFHHEKVDLGVLLHFEIDVVGPNDIGMIERRDGSSLAIEPV